MHAVGTLARPSDERLRLSSDKDWQARFARVPSGSQEVGLLRSKAGVQRDQAALPAKTVFSE
jgi:hypothetical protein